MTATPDLKTRALGFARARWTDFQGFSAGQKAVTVVAVLALAIGGYLLATWTSSPTYAPLYSNLAASDASAIVGKLQDKNIPYRLTDGGAGISVPASQVDTARLTVSAAGLPNSGQTGYALLDKEGVTTSQFKQQVDYQRAVEGELARTIGSIDGVQAASVHLAIPKDDVFSDGSQQPTAAVLLTVAPSTTLTSTQVQSVVYLVSSSVTGMKPGNVTVTDSDGDVLSAPNGGLTGAVTTETQAKAAQAVDVQYAADLQSLIDASLGPGHAKVVVNAALDFDRSTTKTNRYLYDKNTPPVSQSTSQEKYSGTGGAAGGTLGTVDTTGSATGKPGTYDKTDTTVNNALGTQSNTTVVAPGGLKNLHIAVLLDQRAANLDLARIESIVKSGVGFDATRGDTLSVQAVPFDTSAQTAAARAARAAAAASAARRSHEQLIGYVKQGALAAVLLALLVGTWLATRRRRSTPPEPEPYDDRPPLLDDLLPDPLPAAAAEPVADPLLNDSHRFAEQRRALVRAADHRPAEVAHLLSGWLSTKETGR